MRAQSYTTLVSVAGVLIALGAAGCVGPDPVFRFGVMTDDGGTGTGAGGSTTTGAGGSTGTGGSTGAGGTVSTGTGGHGGSGGAVSTGGSGGSVSTGGTTGGGGGSGGAAGTGGAPGTVLLMDDFESGSTSNWIANVAGEWAIVMDGTNKVYEVTGLTNSLHAVAGGNVSWTNIAIEAKVKVVTTGGSSSSYFSGPCVRFANVQNYYCAAVRSDGKFAIRARLNDSGTSLATASSSVSVTTNTWYTVKIAVQGSTITGFLNGTQVVTATDSTIAAGGVALAAVNETTEFDDVVVTAD